MSHKIRTLVVLLVSIVLLGAAVTLGAQDDWPEACSLPNLEEVMRAMSDALGARADANTVAYLGSLSDIAAAGQEAYYSCFAAVAQSGEDLAGTELWAAHLEGINLADAYLLEVDLGSANLEEADLRRANLEGSDLYDVNLEGANLSGANLRGTDMEGTNLQGANLRGADLQWAYLTGVSLLYADLTDAIFAESTTLPDNTNWTPNTDMARFTDPEHPAFWDPCKELVGGERPSYCRGK